MNTTDFRAVIIGAVAMCMPLTLAAQEAADGHTGATQTERADTTAKRRTSKVEAYDQTVSSIVAADYRFRIGGYGEMLATFKNYGTNRFYGSSHGNSELKRNSISIPRFVLALDYVFTPNWILNSEVEFESGGTGTAYELENTENGEYETEVEKGGEVAIEQFNITRYINRYINVRFGHIIVPVGLTNEHHEPMNFFGAERPEGETTMLPSTWHETGVELFGQIGRGMALFDYEVQVVAGLNANGFDRNTWVAGGKQGIFEADNFTCPAVVGRLNYVGIDGLRAGMSVYYLADAGKNADKHQTYSSAGRVAVTIVTADAQYVNRYVTLRGNVVTGTLAESEAVSQINARLSNKSPYSRIGPVAHKVLSYGAEAGLNIAGLAKDGRRLPHLVPFARYEYYNTQKKGEGMQTMDDRCEVSMWSWGLNYSPAKGITIKADYTKREIGTSSVFGSGKYNAENEMRLALTFAGWYFKVRS